MCLLLWVQGNKRNKFSFYFELIRCRNVAKISKTDKVRNEEEQKRNFFKLTKRDEVFFLGQKTKHLNQKGRNIDICSFTSQNDSSSAVSLHSRIVHMWFNFTEGQFICGFTSQKDSSFVVSLHRRIVHMWFHFTEGQFIWGFNSQKDSSCVVSLHRRIAHMQFHYIKRQLTGVSLHRRTAHQQFYYTDGQLFCYFTSQSDSSSVVSLHRRIANMQFHYST